MKTTSISKGSTPEHYVRELRLRSPVSSQVYLSTYHVLELALYHSLGKLPEPESTHDFF